MQDPTPSDPAHAAPVVVPNASLGHVLISSVKDEGPFVLEFVAHHRVLGFDLICIASNDCTDGTHELLEALDAAGAIRHLPNRVAPGEIPQHAGYAAMRRRFGLNRAEWLMVLDVDEFLQVTVGAGRVQDLTAAVPAGTDIIMLHPHSFGTSADPGWSPGLVTEQFQRRVAARHGANRPVKSLARGLNRFGQIHNHSVMRYRDDTPLLVARSDLSTFTIPPGEALWKHLRNVRLDEIRRGIAHYNHYAIKSLASFCLRGMRGRGAAPKGHENDRHTLKYFERLASGQVVDTTLTDRYGAALRAEMARLLADPAVAAAQAEAERRYGDRIDALG